MATAHHPDGSHFLLILGPLAGFAIRPAPIRSNPMVGSFMDEARHPEVLGKHLDRIG